MHDLTVAYIKVITILGLLWTILNIAHVVNKAPVEYRFFGLLVGLGTLLAYINGHSWFHFSGIVFGVGSVIAHSQALGFASVGEKREP